MDRAFQYLLEKISFMQFGFVKLTELNFETLDRNYILTKNKNLGLNLRACAGKEMGRPSGAVWHRAQLTGGSHWSAALKTRSGTRAVGRAIRG